MLRFFRLSAKPAVNDQLSVTEVDRACYAQCGIDYILPDRVPEADGTTAAQCEWPPDVKVKDEPRSDEEAAAVPENLPVVAENADVARPATPAIKSATSAPRKKCSCKNKSWLHVHEPKVPKPKVQKRKIQRAQQHVVVREVETPNPARYSCRTYSKAQPHASKCTCRTYSKDEPYVVKSSCETEEKFSENGRVNVNDERRETLNDSSDELGCADVPISIKEPDDDDDEATETASESEMDVVPELCALVKQEHDYDASATQPSKQKSSHECEERNDSKRLKDRTHVQGPRTYSKEKPNVAKSPYAAEEISSKYNPTNVNDEHCSSNVLKYSNGKRNCVESPISIKTEPAEDAVVAANELEVDIVAELCTSVKQEHDYDTSTTQLGEQKSLHEREESRNSKRLNDRTHIQSHRTYSKEKPSTKALYATEEISSKYINQINVNNECVESCSSNALKNFNDNDMCVDGPVSIKEEPHDAAVVTTNESEMDIVPERFALAKQEHDYDTSATQLSKQKSSPECDERNDSKRLKDNTHVQSPRTFSIEKPNTKLLYATEEISSKYSQIDVNDEHQEGCPSNVLKDSNGKLNCVESPISIKIEPAEDTVVIANELEVDIVAELCTSVKQEHDYDTSTTQLDEQKSLHECEERSDSKRFKVNTHVQSPRTYSKEKPNTKSLYATEEISSKYINQINVNNECQESCSSNTLKNFNDNDMCVDGAVSIKQEPDDDAAVTTTESEMDIVPELFASANRELDYDASMTPLGEQKSLHKREEGNSFENVTDEHTHVESPALLRVSIKQEQDDNACVNTGRPDADALPELCTLVKKEHDYGTSSTMEFAATPDKTSNVCDGQPLNTETGESTVLANIQPLNTETGESTVLANIQPAPNEAPKESVRFARTYSKTNPVAAIKSSPKPSNDPFICGICGKMFRVERSCRQHIQRFHQNKEFKKIMITPNGCHTEF